MISRHRLGLAAILLVQLDRHPFCGGLPINHAEKGRAICLDQLKNVINGIMEGSSKLQRGAESYRRYYRLA